MHSYNTESVIKVFVFTFLLGLNKWQRKGDGNVFADEWHVDQCLAFMQSQKYATYLKY